MTARLVLLLPAQAGRKRSAGSVYVTFVRRDGVSEEVSLFEEFNQKANAWDHERRDPQLRELRGLLQQVELRGCKELFRLSDDTLRDRHGEPMADASRDEGGATGLRALPLSRYEGWRNDLSSELTAEADKLTGLDALRIYCYRFSDNLILFGGNVKRANRVADVGSNVLTEFKEATRIARALRGFEQSGRLRNSPKAGGRIDPDRLGWFDVPK